MEFLHPQSILSFLDIDEGMHVADFGSGSGFFTHALAKKVGPYGRVYAVDHNKDALAKIEHEARRQDWGHVHPIYADLSSDDLIPLEEKVDSILIVNTLHAVESKRSLLSHAYRTLKPGGKIVIVDATPQNPTRIRKEYILEEPEAVRLSELAGFVRERRFHAGNFHYGFIFKKI